MWNRIKTHTANEQMYFQVRKIIISSFWPLRPLLLSSCTALQLQLDDRPHEALAHCPILLLLVKKGQAAFFLAFLHKGINSFSKRLAVESGSCEPALHSLCIGSSTMALYPPQSVILVHSSVSHKLFNRTRFCKIHFPISLEDDCATERTKKRSNQQRVTNRFFDCRGRIQEPCFECIDKPSFPCIVNLRFTIQYIGFKLGNDTIDFLIIESDITQDSIDRSL